ncbi:MAG: AAA family ATPase, partial [Caulobacteraceae bacterium]
MLIGLGIRDFILVDSLDLAFAPGLTALTGETGAGKSIILGALGMALGGRCDAAVVRRGAAQAVATAIFAASPSDPAWAYLDEKGLAYARDEDLVLRRTLSADGRSRAFVNDQAVGAVAMRDLAALLVETHGQHETVGLLDPRTHRGLLDVFGGLAGQGDACLNAWTAWRRAVASAEALLANRDRAAQETEDVAHRLAELDRLSPRAGEEATLAAERRLLSTADKAIADLAQAREQLDDDVVLGRLSQARRAVQRARETVIRALGDEAGTAGVDAAPGRMAAAAEAIERACVEAAEAAAALDVAAQAFRFEPARLDQAEERLFALRAMARKLGVEVDALPEERARLARRLVGLETAGGALAAAEAEAEAAGAGYAAIARGLSAARRAAGA